MRNNIIKYLCVGYARVLLYIQQTMYMYADGCCTGSENVHYESVRIRDASNV